MGSWGSGIFQNDAAVDFVADAAGPDDLRRALEQAVSGTMIPAELIEQLSAMTGKKIAAPVRGYVDVDDSQRALVAAECLAAALGNASAGFAGSRAAAALREWNWTPTREDVDLAEEAIRRVGSESELRSLKVEADEADAWSETLSELLLRLGRSEL